MDFADILYNIKVIVHNYVLNRCYKAYPIRVVTLPKSESKNMGTKRFFDETTEQSLVKSTIVSKYFNAWAKVVIPTAKKGSRKIAYIDLFSGKGRYEDGTKSTPLMILEKAIQDADMREMLITIFNDANEDHAESLETAIKAFPDIRTLNHEPKILNEEVGSDKIFRLLASMKSFPMLLFADPWGYKDLTLRLLRSVLINWGCDCIFFFNYNRINPALNNPCVEEHINALLGKERADALRHRLKEENMSSVEREYAILEEIVSALKGIGGEYVLPFCFKNGSGTRTSHHLIFVTKHPKGYGIMKDIMAKESSSDESGVPSFGYNPADRRFPTLFEFTHKLDDLEDMLLSDFAGKTLKMEQIFLTHNVGKAYISKNYKDVLKKLESADKIAVNPPASKRRRLHGEVTFAGKVWVTFPERSK